MARTKKDEFARGTLVGIRFGSRVRRAVILEDRGMILADHRLVRIRLGEDPDNQDALDWEVPADELEPVPAAA